MSRRIDELSWPEFDRLRKETDTVIVPLGAVEIYGPHLPMGTDGIVALELATRVAERAGALVAPLISLGESSMLLDCPGTHTIRKSTLEALVDDLCANLIRYGFKNFLFIDGHAGNVETVSYLARRYQREHGVRCAQVDWWRFAAAHSEGILELSGPMAHGHASECGTSVMLYLRPDLVDMSKAARVEPPAPAPEKNYGDFIRYLPFKDRTPNGIVGDATIASAEKGRALVERCVQRMVSFVESEFAGGPGTGKERDE